MRLYQDVIEGFEIKLQRYYKQNERLMLQAQHFETDRDPNGADMQSEMDQDGWKEGEARIRRTDGQS